VSQQINLYSPIFRKQVKVFSATTMLQGFALIVAVVAVFFYSISLQSSVLQIRAAESGRQLKSEVERLKAYGAGDSPAERAKALAERKKALEASLAGHTQVLAVFESGELGQAEGYSEVLRALARISIEGVWLTRIQFAEGGGKLSIAGRATRADLVPAYLERLRSEAALRGQKFSKLEVTRTAAAAAKPDAAPGAPLVEFVLSSAQAETAK
jgi:Tfp pilus assembly protein PilN